MSASPSSRVAPGRCSVEAFGMISPCLSSPASWITRLVTNCSQFASLSFIASVNAPSAISPGPVGSYPAMTWFMSWLT